MRGSLLFAIIVFSCILLFGCITNGPGPEPTPTIAPTPENQTNQTNQTPVPQYSPIILTENLTGVFDVDVHHVDDGSGYYLPNPS